MFNRNNSEKLINSLESLTYCDRILEVIKLGRTEKEAISLLLHKLMYI